MLFTTKRLEGVEYKIARTQEEKERVYRLLHNIYVGVGYIKPDDSGMKVLPHHQLSATKIFVAEKEDRILATIGFYPDAELGLPTLDWHFRKDIDQFREQGRRVAEIGSLATVGHLGAEKISILMHMNRMIFHYAISQELDLLVIRLHPRHQKFYEDILLFEQFGTIKHNTRADGSSSIALKLDLRTALSRIRDKYANSRQERNLYQFIINVE